MTNKTVFRLYPKLKIFNQVIMSILGKKMNHKEKIPQKIEHNKNDINNHQK